jgi:hypothetical protein
MDLTPLAKDDPIDQVEFTGSRAGVRGALIAFFQTANFRW